MCVRLYFIHSSADLYSQRVVQKRVARTDGEVEGAEQWRSSLTSPSNFVVWTAHKLMIIYICFDSQIEKYYYGPKSGSSWRFLLSILATRAFLCTFLRNRCILHWRLCRFFLNRSSAGRASGLGIEGGSHVVLPSAQRIW